MWRVDPMLGFDIRLKLRPETVHCSTKDANISEHFLRTFPCIITLRNSLNFWYKYDTKYKSELDKDSGLYIHKRWDFKYNYIEFIIYEILN